MGRGCRKQTQEGNSFWVVAQMGTRGATVACWEPREMAAS